MRTHFFSGLIFSLLLMSCSADDTIMTESNVDNFKVKTDLSDKSHEAANTANAYDIAGALYNKIYDDSNISGIATPSGIITNVESNAFANADFGVISDNYTGISAAQVQWVLDNSSNPASIIATGSTVAIRQKLTTLNSMLDSYQNSSFQQFKNAMLSYELGIINSSTLTAQEKKILLITSSIARYGFYKMSNGGGGGWNKVKLGVYGSITGAETNMATAITLSVSAGIAAGN